MKLDNVKYRKTQYPELLYAQFDHDRWRFVTADDFAEVGPEYPTKGALLNDLHRYAAFYGCEGAAENAFPTVELTEEQKEHITKLAAEVFALGMDFEKGGWEETDPIMARYDIERAGLVQRIFRTIERPTTELEG